MACMNWLIKLKRGNWGRGRMSREPDQERTQSYFLYEHHDRIAIIEEEDVC